MVGGVVVIWSLSLSLSDVSPHLPRGSIGSVPRLTNPKPYFHPSAIISKNGLNVRNTYANAHTVIVMTRIRSRRGFIGVASSEALVSPAQYI